MNYDQSTSDEEIFKSELSKSLKNKLKHKI